VVEAEAPSTTPGEALKAAALGKPAPEAESPDPLPEPGAAPDEAVTAEVERRKT
jgi:hypothetical protein